MKDVLPKRVYEHFLCLSVSIRILCHTHMCINHRPYAQELLIYFVKNFGELYGVQHISYNVHNLIHLSNDVALFGPLDSFSAFKFKNYLYKLKSKIHTGKNYLEQVFNRLHEATKIKENEVKVYPIIHFKDAQNDIIKKIEFAGFSLSTNEFDNCCFLHDGSVIFVEKISYQNHISFSGKCVTKRKSFFNTPCDSIDLSILLISKNDMFVIDSVNVNQVREKGVALFK